MTARRIGSLVACCLVAYSLSAQLTTTMARTSIARVLAPTFSAIVFDIGSNGLNLNGQTTTALVTGTNQTYRWTTASTDDAFLLMDATALRTIGIDVRRADGVAVNGHVLFADGLRITLPDGSNFISTDGWQTLGRFDANRDGQINSLDPVFSRLRLFADANADGSVAAGELSSLSGRGLKTIRLQTSSPRSDSFGNTLVDASFTRTDGTTGLASDVNFGAG